MTPENFEYLKEYALRERFVDHMDQFIYDFMNDSTVKNIKKIPLHSFVSIWYRNKTDLPFKSITKTHYEENITYLVDLYKERSTFWTMEQL